VLFWQPIMQRRRQQQRLVHIRGSKALSHGRILTPYSLWKRCYVWCFSRIYSRQTPSHEQMEIVPGPKSRSGRSGGIGNEQRRRVYECYWAHVAAEIHLVV